MKGSGSRERVWLLRGTVVAVALIAAVVAEVTTGDDGKSAGPAESVSRVVGETELADAAARLGQPIYWAGAIDGTDLELEEIAEGGARVRYVPEGEGGKARTEVLTVGTYPLDDPAGALEQFGRRPDVVARRTSDGLEVFYSREAPTNVYFADPGGGVQVEIYDPSAAKTMSLALSGKVEPVE